MKIITTRKQDQWLDQHGGRAQRHVQKDKTGLFVLMSDGHGAFKKVYLPV